MNLDELQSVQARERQSSDLQHLRSSFYREVGEYIHDLTEERARLVEAADDPFSSPEVRKRSDDIETAEGTVEAIYERRVGKVVKKASIAAAGMPVDDDGLTDEEETLFEDLVDRIERNRESVLAVLDGEGPSVSCSIDGGAPEAASADPDPTPETAAPTETPADEGVDAADLMGSGPQDAGAEASSGSEAGEAGASGAPGSAPGQRADSPPEPPTADLDPVEEPPPDPTDAGSAGETDGDSRPADRSSEDDGTAGSGETLPGMPRTTVRITDEVGEVVGADDRDYDLGAEDVVTLPESNADVLVDKDAAERLE
jgi:DNA replication factor GINS